MRLEWHKNKNSITYRAVKTIRVERKNKTLPIKIFGSENIIVGDSSKSVHHKRQNGPKSFIKTDHATKD